MKKEKTKKKTGRVFKIFLILLVLAALAGAGFYVWKNLNTHRLVVVEDFDGDVYYERKGESNEVFSDMHLISNDKVTVKKKSSLELLIDSDKHVIAEENTEFEIVATGNEDDGRVTIKLEKGKTLIDIEEKLSDDSTFEVNTPNASMSVRGTTFTVIYDKSSGVTILYVEDGKVRVKTARDEEDVKKGECVIIKDDKIEEADYKEALKEFYGQDDKDEDDSDDGRDEAGKDEEPDIIEAVEIPGILFASECPYVDGDTSAHVYMLMENSDGGLISKINDRSENASRESLDDLEAVVLTPSNLCFPVEAGYLVRMNIRVYQLSEDTIMTVRDYGVGAAGPNDPWAKTDFYIYNISATEGFSALLHVTVSDSYGDYAYPIYNFTEREYYVDDNLVTESDAIAALSEYGVGITEESIFISELGTNKQEMVMVIADTDADALLLMESRDAQMPDEIESVKNEHGIN